MDKIKTNRILVVMLILLSMFSLTCYADETISNDIKEEQFKVVGYYCADYFDEPLDKLQTDKLTHVIYGFLIPNEDGTVTGLNKPDQLKELVKQAHNDGAKVFIALGGWSYKDKVLEPVFKEVAASNEKRAIFINNICGVVDEYGLDGVDLDWEHPNSATMADYERFVIELNAALKIKGKELSAALNGAWSSTDGPEPSKLITDKCLENFSFINIMAYDMNNEAHSPLWFAETSIDYWLKKGVPANKIVLGMPLYAKPSWLQYRMLIDMNPEYAYLDFVDTTPLKSYYNGINTLREKTMIALGKAGGVMLFDVNEDVLGDNSVVSMIEELVEKAKNLTKDQVKKYIIVIINNKEISFDSEEGFGVPFINGNNNVMIPLRKPLEFIGTSLSYDNLSCTVSVKKDGITVEIPIGKKFITVNGKEVKTDSNAVIKNGRTYVPLRAVFAAFGYNIDWHGNSRTVIISN